MKAMLLEHIRSPLKLVELPRPKPGPGQVLVSVIACGICRTDLHVIDGDLPNPRLPLILGHEVVGVVESLGDGVHHLAEGDRVGIPWLSSTCSQCSFCAQNRENLCDNALFTGYLVNGGFAEYCAANADFVFRLPEKFSDTQAPPLLCAGLIGYRSYKMTGDAKRIGFYGFGSSAHILIQVAKQQGKEVYVFVRPGNARSAAFAKQLGADWVGASGDAPPFPLDAAILFAPVGSLLPEGLKAVVKGGVVVCAGIHMSDIPSFPYRILWEERQVRSVANLTREDGREFFSLASSLEIHTEVTTFPLEKANEAIGELRKGKINGTAVLTI